MSNSFFLGGLECATRFNRQGKSIDLIPSTGPRHLGRSFHDFSTGDDPPRASSSGWMRDLGGPAARQAGAPAVPRC